MSLQEEGISDKEASRWLFEAYHAVAPTAARGKKRKREVGEAATTSAPEHLQSPTPVKRGRTCWPSWILTGVRATCTSWMPAPPQLGKTTWLWPLTHSRLSAPSLLRSSARSSGV
ncbi:hypothetical protein E2562_006980 [Oryza meyeriana var. granulata]|uniref:Uncharacterized protein n=1 Tax=Oryza meyeriana var. granulata TaxID=110450 RepID=A0A6G1EAE0_9ORYZ|nr:hypothetical protein E2562_006980 [Oryza meyeriana var. granulata]